MSATYRIETAHEPNGPDDIVPWIARIYRLSDDEYVQHAWGVLPDAAEESARSWIRASQSSPPIVTVYVDDLGRDAEAPQSVKVP